MTRSPSLVGAASWRSPMLIIVCGCLLAALSFGPRSTSGVFMTPISQANGWGREVLAFALALQNLLWGIGQPISGAIADRFGTFPVMVVAAIGYAAGLALMTVSSTPMTMDLSAGLLVGLGLSGCSFNLVLSSFGKLLPLHMRPAAFGVGTAAGSFGQFLFSPLAVALKNSLGWENAMLILALTVAFTIPLAFIIATPPQPKPDPSVREQSFREALMEAGGHRSYLLLVAGFFTCGFQLQFATVHLPAYLVDRGMSVEIGGWTIAVIGLFNIAGSITSGWLSMRMPMRYLLSVIYLLRAAAIVALITLPMSPLLALSFGAMMGLLWLSTVPPTNGLVLMMFGTRWFAMLTGVAFFSHQVGAFIGVWLGGVVFERTGSYDMIWWLGVVFGVLSAIINLPIEEKPAARLAAPAAA